ncbi:MAG TPA: acyl-CoA reductase, partial [Longimicrobiales bacterium]|nr:acyl-CoA reductase [Longimicrobiales bacterium]
RAIVDGMAADWTAPRLLALLEAEMGGPDVLDGFVDWPGGRRVRALGAPVAVHVSSGSVPGVSTTSLVRSLLVKSAVLLKPGRGDAVLPVLFLRALVEADEELARAGAVVYWPGGDSAAEDAVLAAADLVVAYGSDASVSSVRRRVPAHVPLVRYHHRASAAVVGREALSEGTVDEVAAAAARAVALFDQRGCVSPQVVWVEEGGESSARTFAAALARALSRLEEELPGPPLTDAEASALQQLRGVVELRAAAGEALEMWSGGEASWTVVYEEGGASPGGGPPRFVRVRPVADVREVGPEQLAPLAHHLQTVAVAGLGTRRDEVAELLARAGAVRVTSLARSPWPPPWWHHDGAGPLRPLVRWIDLEDED